MRQPPAPVASVLVVDDTVENLRVLSDLLGEQGYVDITTAYSDSRADLPLLQAARRPVVVNPKEDAVAAFRRDLPPGTPILNWGCKGRAGEPVPGGVAVSSELT